MTLLCICTGNTCRSPMAAALLQQELKRRGITDGIVSSAGVAADGSPATPNAVKAMAEKGLDIADHRSHTLTLDEAMAADGIFAMTPTHKQILTAAGIPSERIFVPSPPVSDPFGGDEDTYHRTADELQTAIAAFVDTLFPTVKVRRMIAADAEALAAIEEACFAHPWSETALLEEVDNPNARFFVAERDGIVGYAGMHIGGDEGFIDNVAVSPDHRRQGVATALMAALLTCGREEHLYRLTLEVRLSNEAAIALYERHGFVKDGVRPGFYRDPPEDAAIYSYYYEKETPA